MSEINTSPSALRAIAENPNALFPYWPAQVRQVLRALAAEKEATGNDATLATVRARLLEAEESRDAAIARAEKAEAEREAEKAIAATLRKHLEGAHKVHCVLADQITRLECNLAVAQEAEHPPCDPADPCAFAQDLASESRTLDDLLAEAKERATGAEARAERMRAALLMASRLDTAVCAVTPHRINGPMLMCGETGLVRLDLLQTAWLEARTALAEQEADRG